MEALILILIEALAPLLAALFGAIGTLIVSVASAIFSLLLELTGLLIACCGTRAEKTTSAPTFPSADPTTAKSNTEPVPVASSTTATPTRRRRWTRWLLYGTSGLTAAALLTLVVINQWFIDDLARWLLEKQRQRSGIAITVESLDGSLFTGRFQATGITVRRLDHPAGLIDLTVRQVEATVSVWRVFSNPLVVSSLTVDGVQGRFERGVPGQAPAKKTKTVGVDGERKQKRQFAITDLTITNLAVTYADHTRIRPLIVPVTISRLTSAPLRSQWAVFDVLFRANANGTIAGKPFTISTTGDELGRNTQWQVNGLPVEVLSDQIGGPFTLLSSGVCDVQVADTWRMSDQDRVIVMDWSVVLREVKAEVPEDLSTMMKLLAKPAVAFINAKGDRVPLSFRVEIDENRFHGAASAEAAGLWEVVADSAAATLAKALGIETDAVKGTGDQLLDKTKEALDKWRKKKE